MTRSFCMVLLFAMAGCSGATGDGAAPEGDAAGQGAAGGYVECVVPRPEICTRDYRPVCGLRNTGIRCVTQPCDSWETKTYSNACTACSDVPVYGWRPGECEEEGIVRRE